MVHKFDHITRFVALWCGNKTKLTGKSDRDPHSYIFRTDEIQEDPCHSTDLDHYMESTWGDCEPLRNPLLIKLLSGSKL